MIDNSVFFETLYRRHAILNTTSLALSVVGPLVCTILIGNMYGAGGLSVVAVCSPLFFLGAFLGAILSGGGNVLISRAVARREDDEANRVYSASWVLGICGGAAICLLLLALEKPVLSIIASDHPADISGYYRWVSVTVILTVLQWIPLNLCRLAGRPKVGPAMTGVMAVCSVVFALVFIPSMGIPGAAFGQALGCLCSLAVALLLMRGSLLRFRVTKQLRVREILANGSPFGMERLYTLVGVYVMNVIFSLSGGHIALAVYGVIQVIHRFMTALTGGSANTVIPIAGMLNAERDVANLKKFLKYAALFGNAAVGLSCLLLILFRGALAALFGFTDEPEADLFQYAVTSYALYALFLQNVTVFAAWFNASGRLRLANLLLFLQEFLFLCISAFLLSALFGARAAWASFPVSGVLSVLTLALILFILRRRNNRFAYPFLLDPSAVREGKDLTFSVPNDPAEASKASARISEFCEESGLTQKQTMLIAMSVEEFITLIIRNNERARVLDLSCRLTLGEDEISIRIRDRGRMFDPVAYYREHISGDIERSVDIIGLKYIAGNARLIDYRETFGVNNLLVVIERSG
jgi:Na+-driven multidrug efflux pump